MKKLLVRFLKFLLRKLSKKTHHEFKMSEKKLKWFDEERYMEEIRRTCERISNYGEKMPWIKEVSEEDKKIADVYVYHEANFSVNMKNVPSMLIQGYSFVGKSLVELEVILGGEGELDVFDEIMKKKHLYYAGENTDEENVEISIYSKDGFNRKITLEDIKVISVDAFQCGCNKSNDLCKAIVSIEYGFKNIEKF